ncbi:MAG TPA: hypothetical protein VGN09_18580 [Vicinamibacteria bacterium]
MRSGRLARAGGGPVPAQTPLPEARWQQIWFAALRRPWASMVLVPAHPGASTRFIAEALTAVGRLHGDRPVRLLDAESTDLPDVASVLKSLAAIGERQELAVVAAGCPLAQPASIPIARAADAAVLVLPLGESRFADARRALDLVGRDRFIGAVTLELRKER